MRFRVLVTDGIDREGIALLRTESRLEVDEAPTLPPAELLARIGDYDAIVVRSATKVTRAVLEAGTRLRVVGRAGVGIDNVDLGAATELGIAVINAPSGNTIAVAELWFGLVLGLLRHIPAAHAAMQAGKWERTGMLGGELHGRTLGIIGIGRIGGEVALRARAFGMRLLAFDPYASRDRFQALGVVRYESVDELCAESDVLTVHMPLTDETRGMIGAAQFARCKPGAIVVNCARGGIVDDAALKEALIRGPVGGAALDVYGTEPLTGDHMWRGVPNVILTPHVGASTAEAQRNVAVDACAVVRDALVHGDLSRSLNVTMPAGDWAALQPALSIARRCAAVARALLADAGHRATTGIVLRYGADLESAAASLLNAAALGALEGTADAGRLNIVSARSIAAGRGITLGSGGSALPHPRAIEIELAANGTRQRVAGVAPRDAAPRLTGVGEFRVDVVPRHTLLVLTNRDVPGVIGRVGTVLGTAGVNIAEYHQARLAVGGQALAVIATDGEVEASLREALLAIPDVESASLVRFADGL